MKTTLSYKQLKKLITESIICDPTKDEMIAFLEETSGNLIDLDDYFKVSVEIAIYWFANDYHSGQASNLYSALSTSLYQPGRLENDIESSNDDQAIWLYNELVEEFVHSDYLY